MGFVYYLLCDFSPLTTYVCRPERRIQERDCSNENHLTDSNAMVTAAVAAHDVKSPCARERFSCPSDAIIHLLGIATARGEGFSLVHSLAPCKCSRVARRLYMRKFCKQAKRMHSLNCVCCHPLFAIIPHCFPINTSLCVLCFSRSRSVASSF